MTEPRKRRAFIPGVSDAEDSASLTPSPSIYEKYKNWNEAQARREEKERIAAWMEGIEPRESWEHYNGPPAQSFFCVEFPGTVHYFVVAWERGKSIPHKFDGEIGGLRVWCLACNNDDCGACVWTRKAYTKAVGYDARVISTGSGDLPF